MKRSIIYTISAILIFSVVIIAAGIPDKYKERLTLSGSVTRIGTKGGKTTGNVTFEGSTKKGVKYKGLGRVEVTFDRTRKIVRQMVITFKGTRNGKAVSGKWTFSGRITFSEPIGDRFNIINSVGSTGANDTDD